MPHVCQFHIFFFLDSPKRHAQTLKDKITLPKAPHRLSHMSFPDHIAFSEADIPSILTSDVVHPACAHFAEPRTVVMVSRHAFAFTTLNPLFINVVPNALKVDAQRTQAPKVTPVDTVWILRWARQVIR